MKVSKKVMLSAAVVALTLTGCDQKPNADQQLTAAIAEFTEQADIEYQHAFVDLNHDGVDDALVLLTGNNWCGSGGCTLLILEGKVQDQQADQQGYNVISRSTVTRTPIRVAESESEGWQHLIVHSAGAEKLLEFDGNSYPTNPSMESTATAEQLDEASILLP